MANPSKPDIDYSYAGFQQETQDFPFPGTQLDNDLAELSTSIDQTIDGLADIRRSDGKLQNSIVTADSLDESLLIGLKTPTVWETSTRYIVLDCVSIAETGLQGIYRCLVSHESADFSDDLGAGYWEMIFSMSPAGLGLADVAVTGDYDDLLNLPALGAAAFLNVGTTAGTVAAGNDTRITNAVQTSRTLTAGAGMAAIGNLSADRTIALNSASLASLALADSAVQRIGNETKIGDLRVTDGLLKVFKDLQTIPTTADSAGMIVSCNRSNADRETNIRNMYVNGTGMTKAFVWSQITTAGSAETDLLTLYRNGRAAVGSIGWLEAIAGQAETVSMFTSLSKPGTALALTGASRTSDALAPAYFSGIGVWGFSHNNRARTGDFNTTFMGWGGYFENRRDNGSGRSHGVEIGSVNLGAAGVDPEATLMTPYDYAQANSINGLLLSAGRPDVGAGQHDISNAINVIANGAKYRTGIVFGNGSVAADGPTVPAILMPTLYGFRWHTAEGLRAYFHADQSAGSQTIGMVVRNDSVDVEFQGSTTIRLKTNEIRALNTNGGFDGGATYIGNTTASRQFRLATFDASFPHLYLEINTNTTASPTWTNRGQFNAATGVYSSVSDERLKKNFRPFGRSALDTVSGLASASSHYSMIGDDREHFGYLAGRVLSVFPEGVDAKGKNLMVSDRPISALHSLAIDELKQRVEMLENTNLL
ncbi:tail fiber domain-containing protein [Rhizobium sp. PL01]|uniref:tail fiber domain-containing protein n=1 Tax=Rhizobium sp. PL01 TaxID=3085631 RepID=UPI002981229A|nr:tail fiber domain-containing protein [Rhizobium sp. PL01]MDW5315515.1 tail fiber domain-containing protein [Rhizobium sp. PL01]